MIIRVLNFYAIMTITPISLLVIHKYMELDTKEFLRAIFGLFDLNKNGSISRNELRLVLTGFFDEKKMDYSE